MVRAGIFLELVVRGLAPIKHVKRWPSLFSECVCEICTLIVQWFWIRLNGYGWMNMARIPESYLVSRLENDSNGNMVLDTRARFASSPRPPLDGSSTFYSSSSTGTISTTRPCSTRLSLYNSALSWWQRMIAAKPNWWACIIIWYATPSFKPTISVRHLATYSLLFMGSLTNRTYSD